MRCVIAALAAAIGLLPAVDAHACSCVPSTPQQQAQRADAVFTGTVQRIDSLSQMRTAYTFAVETVYKGAVASSVVIYSNVGGGACGTDFSTRGRYTVFAVNNPQEGGLASNSCAGNTPNPIDPVAYGLPAGHAPSKATGGPVVVNQGSPASPAIDYSWLWVPFGVLIAGSILLAGVWLLLRKRLS
jgi:hypothetical protein